VIFELDLDSVKMNQPHAKYVGQGSFISKAIIRTDTHTTRPTALAVPLKW